MVEKVQLPDGYLVDCDQCEFSRIVEMQETADWLQHSHLRYHERADDKNIAYAKKVN